MISSRRSFLAGLGAALIAGPAIVRATSIMPVKAYEPINIDEIVALLERRMAYAEHNMARQLAQSLYASGQRDQPLDGLAGVIEKDGYRKHEARLVGVTLPASYSRGGEPLVKNEQTGLWTFLANG